MKNMGDGRRISRVESEVQRLVAQYVISKMRDEIRGIVTVARVKMPADLRLAKVYVSVLNPEGDMSDVIEVLQDRAPEIQRFIGDSLRMRYCPKLTFFEDDMTQKVLKVEDILRSLAEPIAKPGLKVVADDEDSQDDE